MYNISSTLVRISVQLPAAKLRRCLSKQTGGLWLPENLGTTAQSSRAIAGDVKSKSQCQLPHRRYRSELSVCPAVVATTETSLFSRCSPIQSRRARSRRARRNAPLGVSNEWPAWEELVLACFLCRCLNVTFPAQGPQRQNWS